MDGWVYILFVLIIIFWVLTGNLEWQLPSGLARSISAWSRSRQEKELRASFILNFDAREFASEDVEKEVYIIRKSRGGTSPGSIVMNIAVQNPHHGLSEEDREKAKARLERRFPGLTVNFTEKEQEGKDAI